MLLSKNRPAPSTESQNFLDPSPRPEFRAANLALIAFCAPARAFFKELLGKVIELDVEAIVLANRTDHARFNRGTILRNLAILIKGNLQSNDAITSNKLS
ncbi:MAG: hypothetical protein DME64_16585 [Verrucomicrobia bacterium]|nr:MAG: hypothetical protein DME64_16585 [Verrucomicrobiota bacterium]